MKTRLTMPIALAFASLFAATASAQEAAGPAAEGGSIPFGWFILILPFVFLGLVLVSMRRAKRLQPAINRSLVIAEENLLLARELIALQKETVRLLGELVAATRPSE